MKRDWELIRQQLTDIEEEKDLFTEIPDEPKWLDQSEEEYVSQMEAYRAVENRILGHLELLVESGYVTGMKIIRGADGSLHYSYSSPRLTMAGHDLLSTMRSSPVWESIKSTARAKGIELTFETVKTLAAFSLKQMFS
jgi:hypothetical protein